MAREHHRPGSRAPCRSEGRPGGPRPSLGPAPSAPGEGLTIRRSGTTSRPAELARKRLAPAILVGVVVAVLAGCGGAGATFSTSGPCVADGRAPGAYPSLEALAPHQLDGKPPTSVDSGRNCSDKALGTLASHGVHEVRFGGATWDLGPGAGTSIAVLALPDGQLPLDWAEEFYLAGALNGTKTDNVKSSHPTIPGTTNAFRVDALNDLSQQAVVLWQVGDAVRVIVVASNVNPNASMADHEARIASAIQAALDAGSTGIPVPSPS